MQVAVGAVHMRRGVPGVAVAAAVSARRAAAVGRMAAAPTTHKTRPSRIDIYRCQRPDTEANRPTVRTGR